MRKIDLYKGFEGETELLIKEKSSDRKILFELRIWYGYWSSILNLIPLSQDYNKESIIYNYLRAGEGWFENDDWECTRVEEFYNQLTDIQNYIEEPYQKAYSGLKEICESALENNNSLYISLG